MSDAFFDHPILNSPYGVDLGVVRDRFESDMRRPFVNESMADVAVHRFRLTRTEGSHHVFVHDTVSELLNLQNASGDAKPYQLRQLLKLVEQYNLTLEKDS